MQPLCSSCTLANEVLLPIKHKKATKSFISLGDCVLQLCNFKKVIFKPGAGRRVPGFLELLLSKNVCMCACVCASAPEAINN